jgi:hypothetical protein
LTTLWSAGSAWELDYHAGRCPTRLVLSKIKDPLWLRDAEGNLRFSLIIK